MSNSRDLEVPGGQRNLMWLYALVYSAFVIYGSLVPLDFRALPLDDAMARFSQIQLLKLGVGSRADWVANLILYVPLGYLILGAFAGCLDIGNHYFRFPCRWDGVINRIHPVIFSSTNCLT